MMTQDIDSLDRALNDLIVQGRILEAFDRFYAEDVTMQENDQPPTVGKQANRVREEEFVASVGEVHEVALRASSVGEDGLTFGQWTLDITYKGGGRVRSEQVAVRRWRDGKVVHEQFFHA